MNVKDASYMDMSTYIHAHEIGTAPVEDIFQRLVRRGNGGIDVYSNAAPALSTEFVRSHHSKRVTAQSEGAFAEISYPDYADMNAKHARKHGNDMDFGYASTFASDVYPAGFGERAARALAREENVYQLKGTFPTAAVAYAKLRARVAAREGDVDAIDSIFSYVWGLEKNAVLALPRLHVEGSEATRMAAMEDRAYHALSGHPGHHGGYRVDTATIASDALGANIPINWPRLRTALKAIAEMQVQGDVQMASIVERIRRTEAAKFTMGMAVGSQPAYKRSPAWETVLNLLITRCFESKSDSVDRQVAHIQGASMQENSMHKIVDDDVLHVIDDLKEIAGLVSKMSLEAAVKVCQILLAYSDEHVTLENYNRVDYAKLKRSELSEEFHVPHYKLTRESLLAGVKSPYIAPDGLPDIRSFEPVADRLNFRELREANMMHSLDIAGALNLAVFITCMNPMIQPRAYSLMHLLPNPHKDEKVAIALRRENLYSDPRIRALGTYLFGDIFLNTLDMICKNLLSPEYKWDGSLKQHMWSYLNGRCHIKRDCPITGDWRDLVIYLRNAPEGWTLYYWIRITQGKRHNQLTDGILAPIANHEVIDFLTLMMKSIRSKAKAWTDFYMSKYQKISNSMTEARKEVSKLEEQEAPDTKYTPPHARIEKDLKKIYNQEKILAYKRGFSQEAYRKMVETQAKAKFFNLIEVKSRDNTIVVGIDSDTHLAMLIEFYQARWFSLDVRIKKAQAVKKPLILGPNKFKEHPWGPLAETFPRTPGGMLYWMSKLDERGWTIHPEELMERMKESLNELWDDCRKEISLIIQYIREVHEGLVELQDEALDQDLDPKVALISLPAIPLPAFGYVPRTQLPQRPMTIANEDEKTTTEVMQSSAAMVEDSETESEEEELPTVDEDYYTNIDMHRRASSFTLTADDTQYLTYREIWHYLALGDEPDNRIKFVMALPCDIDLDQQHINTEYGPLVLKGEEDIVKRRWHTREPLMLRRMGSETATVHEDDM